MQLSHDHLNGLEASVKLKVLSDGSKPLNGEFRIKIDDHQTKPIPYDSNSNLLEEALNNLPNMGSAKVYPMAPAM